MIDPLRISMCWRFGKNPCQGLGFGGVQIFKALFMFKVTEARPKVASGSDYDVAQLDHGRNICAKFEHLPVYGYRDLVRTKWHPPPACPARVKTIPAQP